MAVIESDKRRIDVLITSLVWQPISNVDLYLADKNKQISLYVLKQSFETINTWGTVWIRGRNWRIRAKHGLTPLCTFTAAILQHRPTIYFSELRHHSINFSIFSASGASRIVMQRSTSQDKMLYGVTSYVFIEVYTWLFSKYLLAYLLGYL